MPEPALKLNVEINGAQKGVTDLNAVAAATDKSTQAAEKSASATKKIAGAAKEADDAFAKLGGRNNDAKDVLEGIEGAARGGAGAIFNLAKLWKGLVGVFTGFSPLGVIVAIGTALISLAPKFLPVRKSAEDLAKELEEVRKKADDLNAARLKSFEEQLAAIGRQADATTRKIDLLANSRERISDAVLEKQVAAINADTNLSDDQKAKQVDATRKAREKEKADNEIKDQRAKLKVEQDELVKQQAAAAEIERAARAARAKANELRQADARLKQIPDEVVANSERVREAGGGDFQIIEANKPLLDERRALAKRLGDGALSKAEAEAQSAEKVSSEERRKITPQFDKVRQMQEAIDIEVATRARIDRVEKTKGPITPRLKNELLRDTTNDIFNNGNGESRDGSGGFINGQFVGTPKRSGAGTINGQPLRNALSGPNQVQRTPLDDAAKEIESEQPVNAAPVNDAAQKIAEAVVTQTQASQQSINQAGAQMTAQAAAIPPPPSLDPLLQGVTQIATTLKAGQDALKADVDRISRQFQLLAQQIQSQQSSR